MIGRRMLRGIVLGGQTLALLMTLVGAPVVYSIFDDWARSPLWARRRRLGPTRNGNGREPAAAA